MNLLNDQINSLKKQFEIVVSETNNKIIELKSKIEALIKASSFLEDYWLGQWGDQSYDVYGDFLSNTQKNIRLAEKAIWDYLNKKTGLEFNIIESQIPDLTKKHRELRDETITELSIIKSMNGFEKEIELLDSIENFKWGFSSNYYVNQRSPQQMVVYDYSILNQGPKIPPHIVIGGDLISRFSNLVSLEQFQALVKRLFKQLELKQRLFSIPVEVSEDKVSLFLLPIIERFHKCALQLRNRHDSRSTLTITDEYDVQDLLHSILKINFEDVRPEEAVPSYAGKNTRVDFLLKRESTLIEVKKTRSTLKDKEIGDQLILDVAHYKSHPDCKRLICFVYDPDSLISNPRGLEDDLNRLTSDDLLVEIYIRP